MPTKNKPAKYTVEFRKIIVTLYQSGSPILDNDSTKTSEVIHY